AQQAPDVDQQQRDGQVHEPQRAVAGVGPDADLAQLAVAGLDAEAAAIGIADLVGRQVAADQGEHHPAQWPGALGSDPNHGHLQPTVAEARPVEFVDSGVAAPSMTPGARATGLATDGAGHHGADAHPTQVVEDLDAGKAPIQPQASDREAAALDPFQEQAED